MEDFGGKACYTEGSLLPDDVEYGFHKTEKYRGFACGLWWRGKDCMVPSTSDFVCFKSSLRAGGRAQGRTVCLSTRMICFLSPAGESGNRGSSTAQLLRSSNEKMHLSSEVLAAPCLFLLATNMEPVNNSPSTPINHD